VNIFQCKIEAHYDLSLAEATLYVTHFEGSTRTRSSNALCDLGIFLEQSLTDSKVLIILREHSPRPGHS
jgi:hypothetical protein